MPGQTETVEKLANLLLELQCLTDDLAEGDVELTLVVGARERRNVFTFERNLQRGMHSLQREQPKNPTAYVRLVGVDIARAPKP